MTNNTNSTLRTWTLAAGVAATAGLGAGTALGSQIGWDLPVVPNALGPVEGTWAGPNNGQSGSDFRASSGSFGTTDGAVYEVNGQPMWYTMNQSAYGASLTDPYSLNEWSRRHDFSGAAIWTDSHDEHGGSGDVTPRHETSLLRVSGPSEEGHGGEPGRQIVLMFRAPHSGIFTLDMAGELTSHSSSGSTYNRLEIFKINDALDTAESIDQIYLSDNFTPSGIDGVTSFSDQWDISLAEGERLGVRYGQLAGANSITGGHSTVSFDTFHVVPEPGALTLLAGPALLLAMRRRRAEV